MTKRQKIDAMRETRLWVSQIIVPTATLVVTALSIPEVRQLASAKYNEVKQNLTSKLKKK